MMTMEDDRESATSLWASGDPRAVVRRVWYGMAATGAVMVVLAVLLGEAVDSIGVLVGVGLAAVNFRFLETSLRSLLGAGHEKPPTGTSLMFLIRWALVGVAGYLAFQGGFASGEGILIGLFAPAVAIMLEAGFQLVAALSKGSRG